VAADVDNDVIAIYIPRSSADVAIVIVQQQEEVMRWRNKKAVRLQKNRAMPL